MKMRRVGSTDLVVSEIGFGCGGNAGLMIAGSRADQERVIARALDLGVTYFDNAPDYGDGIAERNLGDILKGLGATSPVLNTKVEIRAGDLEDIAGHIVRSLDESLRRLRRDFVDIVQIHNGPAAVKPLLEGRSYKTLWLEDYLRPGGVLDGLHQVLKAGKARYAGFICRGNDAAEVSQLLSTGLFHMINVPYTLLNPTAGGADPDNFPNDRNYGDVIGRAKAAGAGIAIFSPLAGGLLTDAILSGQQTHELARKKDVKALDEKGALTLARTFRAFAIEHRIDVVELAYRFILSNSGVSSVLGGISATEQLEGIVAAASAGPLPDAMLAEIETIWRSQR
jgi:L-glyceraldehyde 3-phosphate reductase